MKDMLEKMRVIADTLPEDDPDKIEMLNVESDYTALMNWALEKRAEYIAQRDVAKELASKYSDRAKMFDGRAESMKGIMGLILSSADERSFKSAYGTVTIKAVPPKPIVVDETMVPDDFKKHTITIDKAAINAAYKNGDTVSGVEMDNGGETIMVRI